MSTFAARVFVLFGCCAAIAPAQEVITPERRPFTRFVERDDGGQLDVLVATYTKGDATLTLHAALHVADPEHYTELTKRFEAFDALLYELIADPELRPYPGMATADDWFNMLQGGMGRGLGLGHQGDHIDYRKANFVHADMSDAEWEAALARAGSSLLGELVAGGKPVETDREAEKKLRPIDLVAAFRSGRGVPELRVIGARVLSEPDPEHREPTVIIEGRNEKCLQVLQAQLAAGKKKLGIYYGAAHMEHMERRLLKDLGWTRTNEQWLQAWDNRASRFPVVEKGLQQKRYRAHSDIELLTASLRAWLNAHADEEPTWPRLRAYRSDAKLPGRNDGKDPWGHDYVLRSTRSGFEVRGLGSDGVIDTEDDLAGESVERGGEDG